ncbi:MAG: DinB family protein [Anaerolineae bacterium]
MNALQFFLKQHAHLHSAGVGETEGALFEDRVLSDLNEDQIRLRPREGLNSVAWLIWHMARTEDVLVNVGVAGRSQVLDEDNWLDRLKVPRRDIGTGMTSEEVSELSAALDISALRAYRASVGRRTQEIVRALRPEELDEVIAESHLRRAISEGAFGPNAGWVVESAWRGKTKGYVLGRNSIVHNALHLGEALAVRSQAGLGLGV